MTSVHTRVAGFAAAVLVCVSTAADVVGQATTPASVVQQAATAMGGADKLRGIRNITLRGYGMAVYQNGAGRITGEPDAPEKFIAVNDMERIYDLQNNRMQFSERRNNLFPFLGTGAHAWNLNVQRPAADSFPALNNPAVMIRAMLDPSATLSAVRMEGPLRVIDVVLASGVKFSASFREDNLPMWIRWVQASSNFGQLTYTTYFTGWTDASGVAGFQLPLGYVTRQDWRDVESMKIFVDAYSVDTQLPDLTAPLPGRGGGAGPAGGGRAGGAPAQAPAAGARAGGAPAQAPGGRAGGAPAQAAGGRAGGPAGEPAPITSKVIGKGIWRVDQGGTMVIEFSDHVVIYELNINVAQAKRVLAHARTLVPGKPLRYYITSHHHQDHTAGLRQAVAEGLTVVQRKSSESQLREMGEHRAPDFPDDQERMRTPFKFLAVDEHLRMSDSTQTIDIYHVPQNGHMADAIVIYIPSEKMMMEGDLVSASLELQHWPDGFRDTIARYKLDVEWVAPVHPDALEQGQGRYSKAYVEKFLKEGTDRARAHCKLWLDLGVYHSGCPIQTKYY